MYHDMRKKVERFKLGGSFKKGHSEFKRMIDKGANV